MHTPRILALAALSLASLSFMLAAPLVPAGAQAPPPPPPMMHGPMGGGPYASRMHGGGRMTRMADQLGLTDAQKSKLMPIAMASRQQMQAIFSNPKLTPAARMAKMQAMQKSNQAKIMSILTPAQRVKMKAMIAQHPSGFGGPRPGGPRPGGFGGPPRP